MTKNKWSCEKNNHDLKNHERKCKAWLGQKKSHQGQRMNKRFLLVYSSKPRYQARILITPYIACVAGRRRGGKGSKWAREDRARFTQLARACLSAFPPLTTPTTQDTHYKKVFATRFIRDFEVCTVYISRHLNSATLRKCCILNDLNFPFLSSTQFISLAMLL